MAGRTTTNLDGRLMDALCIFCQTDPDFRTFGDGIWISMQLYHPKENRFK